MEGIAWRWQSIDGALLKAPLAQESVGPNPTDREKNGSKRMLLVDARGVPLSIIVTAANRNDITELTPTLDAVVLERPPGDRAPASTCAPTRASSVRLRTSTCSIGTTPRMCARGERSAGARARGKRPRRWVVEAAHAWFTRFRKLLVRYEKTHRAYLALTMLAAAIISFRHVPRKINIIYG